MTVISAPTTDSCARSRLRVDAAVHLRNAEMASSRSRLQDGVDVLAGRPRSNDIITVFSMSS